MERSAHAWGKPIWGSLTLAADRVAVHLTPGIQGSCMADGTRTSAGALRSSSARAQHRTWEASEWLDAQSVPQQLPQHLVMHEARRRDAERLEQELAEHLEHHLCARRNRAWYLKQRGKVPADVMRKTSHPCGGQCRHAVGRSASEAKGLAQTPSNANQAEPRTGALCRSIRVLGWTLVSKGHLDTVHIMWDVVVKRQHTQCTPKPACQRCRDWPHAWPPLSR